MSRPHANSKPRVRPHTSPIPYTRPYTHTPTARRKNSLFPQASTAENKHLRLFSASKIVMEELLPQREGSLGRSRSGCEAKQRPVHDCNSNLHASPCKSWGNTRLLLSMIQACKDQIAMAFPGHLCTPGGAGAWEPGQSGCCVAASSELEPSLLERGGRLVKLRRPRKLRRHRKHPSIVNHCWGRGDSSVELPMSCAGISGCTFYECPPPCWGMLSSDVASFESPIIL